MTTNNKFYQNAFEQIYTLKGTEEHCNSHSLPDAFQTSVKMIIICKQGHHTLNSNKMRDGQILRTFLFGRIYRSLQWWPPKQHNPSELYINCDKASMAVVDLANTGRICEVTTDGNNSTDISMWLVVLAWMQWVWLCVCILCHEHDNLLPASEVQSSCACQEVTWKTESISPVILDLVVDRLSGQPDAPAVFPPRKVQQVPFK